MSSGKVAITIDSGTLERVDALEVKPEEYRELPELTTICLLVRRQTRVEDLNYSTKEVDEGAIDGFDDDPDDWP